VKFLEDELEALRAQNLLRVPAVPPDALILCSNDYLGFAADSRELRAVAGSPPPSGAGASRLISGHHAEHAALEAALAAWVGLPAALVFSSGYAANVGTLAALCGEDDVIVSDALNHASIIDGSRLSRARVAVVPHLDAAAVDAALAAPARRKFVVTESYFSMDGDSPDLPRLRAICDAHGAALIVDEAHALGVFGPTGAGSCRAVGVVPDVLIGTLGKAVGMQGAFVAGSAALASWLWNRARSFVFSTGIAPWLAAALRLRVARVIAADAERARLAAIVARVRSAFSERPGGPAPIAPSHGPIMPWLCGTPERALALRDQLLARGVFVQAIRPPTVPTGTSRLRITLHARLSDADIDRLLAAI
jgi:8-amino-7-oxononanoate synthase